MALLEYCNMLSTYYLEIKLLEYGTYAGLYEGIVGMRVGQIRTIVLPPSSVSTFISVISSWDDFVWLTASTVLTIFGNFNIKSRTMQMYTFFLLGKSHRSLYSLISSFKWYWFLLQNSFPSLPFSQGFDWRTQ